MNDLKVSVTGHRTCERDLDTAVGEFLTRAVARARAGDYAALTVHSGGALGIDQLVAARTLELAATSPLAVHSHIVLPFPPAIMGAKWTAGQREHLATLLARSGSEVLGTEFSFGLYHARNRRLIDVSAFLVAFWDGRTTGGTYACVKDALRRGRATYHAFEGFRRITPADLAA